jgi:twinkle protein
MKNLTINGNLPTILPAGYLKDRMNTIRTKGLPKGFYTGISNLDDVFRLDKGQLITITGVPNCGKSEFVDFYTSVLNKLYGLKTLYFSPENQPCELHVSKLVSKFTNKPWEKLTQAEIDVAIDYICKNFFFCNYDKIKSLNDIEELVVKTISDTPFDILVIDSYNKVEWDRPANETETDFISKVLDKLCEMAIALNIMVILVAHPRKMEWRNSDKYAQCPTAYDINGSANFFNKCHGVFCIGRDGKDDETVTIRVDKVKFSHYGAPGKCLLKYDVASGNYYNAPGKFDFDEKDAYTPIEFTLPSLPAKNEPLDVIVSSYPNVTDTTGTEVNLKDFILSGKYKEVAEQIRCGATADERHDIKKQLYNQIPAVTVSGRFSQHNSEHLIEASGLICIDIDWKDNVDIMPQVPSILQKLKYVAYCGKSISGDGYFAIIPIENPKHFKQHFYALEEEM